MLLTGTRGHYTEDRVIILKFQLLSQWIPAHHHLPQRCQRPYHILERPNLYEVCLGQYFISYLFVKDKIFAGDTALWRPVIAVHIAVGVHSQEVVLAKEDIGQTLEHAGVLLAFVCLGCFAEQWHEGGLCGET